MFAMATSHVVIAALECGSARATAFVGLLLVEFSRFGQHRVCIYGKRGKVMLVFFVELCWAMYRLVAVGCALDLDVEVAGRI